MRGVASVWALLIGAVVVSVARPVVADETESFATLHANAIEVGIAGSLVNIEGITNGSARLRGGYFVAGLSGLMAVESSFAYRHISSLDQFDLEFNISWQKRVRRSSNYPYVSLGGGVRHEDIGSFSQSRYPLGVGLGMRALVGQRAALRVEYQFRRILNDPVASFSEHQIILGLSVFFRNS